MCMMMRQQWKYRKKRRDFLSSGKEGRKNEYELFNDALNMVRKEMFYLTMPSTW